MMYKIYHCKNADLFKVENLIDSNINDILRTIYEYDNLSDEDIQENFNDLNKLLRIEGDFSTPKLAYIYILGDSRIIITDTLSVFKDKTEEEWGVKKWREI